ncbi:MAG: hypothetical protein ACLVHH_10725 [Faecalibacillus intestinalis]|uniref:hypothetical protein n=1 Tax=Faecalibacillus intestinalis TaxID=1982626 RepID=UPI00399AD2F4
MGDLNDFITNVINSFYSLTTSEMISLTLHLLWIILKSFLPTQTFTCLMVFIDDCCEDNNICVVLVIQLLILLKKQ